MKLSECKLKEKFLYRLVTPEDQIRTHKRRGRYDEEGIWITYDQGHEIEDVPFVLDMYNKALDIPTGYYLLYKRGQGNKPFASYHPKEFNKHYEQT